MILYLSLKKILKASDVHKLRSYVHKLQVSQFMCAFHHDLLPKSFFAIKKNLDTSIRITRQCNLLVKERTQFSSKLPKHNFTRIWSRKK